MVLIDYELSETRPCKKSTHADFGKVNMDTLAAAIYTAFHGKCECASHPFYWDEEGGFAGYLPWTENEKTDDKVVESFRLAAIAAMECLKGNGIGRLP